MNHKIGRVVFATIVGLAVAVWSYQWITDPTAREERVQQERVVLSARDALGSTLDLQGLEIVDPLAPLRKVGKVYVYRLDDGWEVSGYYRRGDDDMWHPYLMQLGADLALLKLRVKDSGLPENVVSQAVLELSP